MRNLNFSKVEDEDEDPFAEFSIDVDDPPAANAPRLPGKKLFVFRPKNYAAAESQMHSALTVR